MTVTAESIVWIYRLKSHGSTRLPTGERPRRLKKNRGCYVIALRNFDIVSRKRCSLARSMSITIEIFRRSSYSSTRNFRERKRFFRVVIFESLKSIIYEPRKKLILINKYNMADTREKQLLQLLQFDLNQACKSVTPPITDRGLHSDFFVRRSKLSRPVLSRWFSGRFIRIPPVPWNPRGGDVENSKYINEWYIFMNVFIF